MSCFGRKAVEMSSMELDDRFVDGAVRPCLSCWALSASCEMELKSSLISWFNHTLQYFQKLYDVLIVRLKITLESLECSSDVAPR